MITVDTSVVVAAFARWHEQHEAARAAVDDADAVIAHVAVEAYSVLTRLPPPQRTEGSLVVAFLSHHFPGEPLALPAAEHHDLLAEAAQAQVGGGAVYDALVAATARSGSATLLSLDRPAAGTYRALGVDHRLLS